MRTARLGLAVADGGQGHIIHCHVKEVHTRCEVQAGRGSRGWTGSVADDGGRIMSIVFARNVLLWCTIINYALLLVWFLLYVLARGWLLRTWSRWFPLSAEAFDAINYGGILLYKMLTLFFNLIPFIVLYVVR